MKKSPLAQVQEQFGSKEKLVDNLIGLPEAVLDRHDEDKDVYRKRLLAAANSKLLRLHRIGHAVAERWGSKDKLVDAILALKNRGRDQDYGNKLRSLTLGRLYDQFLSLERAVKRARVQVSRTP